MQRWLIAMALAGLAWFAPAAQAANEDPIVLVHGFGGWGRDEVFGYKHWGGTLDLQEFLKSQGHPTVTVAMGPTSSNWDRAVEAYAQIKGGCVDYGAAHAARHGHARYGRCYAGLHPSWGATKRVHLVSHSQGGPTSNMLIELLRNGSAAERAASGTGTSPLFMGGKDWVHSHTSMAGAHNGTTFGRLTSFNEFAKQLLKVVAGAVGASGADDLPFDFKLDQWGLKRQNGESQASYANRVWASPIWNTQDVALYSLSPEGAAAENQWVKTSSEVIYFSYSVGTTYREPLFGNHLPDFSTNLALSPFATGMGVYRALGTGWLQNDGVVNTISMKAPFGAPTREYDGTARKGWWNHIGHLQADHWDVVGSGDVARNLGSNPYLRDLYLGITRRLKAL